ncbi:ATPase AAA [Vallitalea longa]|uniref:ATPase AAA n=1 Tax=Vallitalea longa TaxID=2936439 RepID=A0A9W5YHL8_9FIRM|nr:AAA family ATPase [Vallitalea longa]GKX31378.1 ATPase AAA [Vallitalea longa]
MINNQIIAVWGSPNSGKTTTSIKIARELSKNKKNVIVVMGDIVAPALMTVLPEIDMRDKSLGKVLSAPQITQESIMAECITLKKNEYIALLSYKQGDNVFTYADYERERAVDFLILLRHLADYIIIDCNSYIENDMLSATALELSDLVLRHITCDLKSISFYDSHLPLIASSLYKADKHIKILSNIKEYQSKSGVIQRYNGVKYQSDYSRELEEQFLCGELLKPLELKESISSKRVITDIADIILYGGKDKKEEKQSEINVDKIIPIKLHRKANINNKIKSITEKIKLPRLNKKRGYHE